VLSLGDFVKNRLLKPAYKNYKTKMNHPPTTTPASLITVKGLVQGVGFRPYVYRLATRMGFHGWVENRTDGVLILLQENGIAIEKFVEALKNEAPAASDIESVSVESVSFEPLLGFEITRSKETSLGTTEISPDIAICADCLRDLKTQSHRINYPLINCTHCGPRFSIIIALPYDRRMTTMALFAMCDLCKAEYADVHDRRFHAQPVACNHCGPVYRMYENIKTLKFSSITQIIAETASRIMQGQIVALKGTGGYHLICDALNETAVSNLRERKKRDGKPLAVMFRNLDVLKPFAYFGETEKKLLQSWHRPVVLLQSKMELPTTISSDLNTIGAILPYMPIHYQLFDMLDTPAIVFTSGNISEEPVVIDDTKARLHLSGITKTFVTYNREIYNRVDDTVVKIISDKPLMIRRSRGFVPKPVKLNLEVEGILAVGAELKNTFCIGKGKQAILSQHIGDLKNMETYEFFTETIERFKQLFRFEPNLVATDLHPDYLSTQYADASGLPIVKVQHHHAHIASCMAENRLDEPVIGLSFDGTGLGADGHIWGSEVMLAGLNTYQRIGHMEYIPLPGGDKAVEEPWRIALSLLYKTFGENCQAYAEQLFPEIPIERRSMIVEALKKNINCPSSSGLGRLFDAVAALIGLCKSHTFEAEGPMRLEDVADKNVLESYPVLLKNGVWMLAPLINELMKDIGTKQRAGLISSKLHNAVAAFAVQSVLQASKESGIKKVVLSGGSFQNRILAEKIIISLGKKNFTTFMQSQVPPNDGGISLGQLAVAAKRRMLSCV
jgi:hydrogenase maturation protein HypF